MKQRFITDILKNLSGFERPSRYIKNCLYHFCITQRKYNYPKVTFRIGTNIKRKF